MRILIGGSPSTGSSVFRQILNRHPAIFCGPETNLLCYPVLYRHWKSARYRLMLPGALGMQYTDVRRIRGVHLVDPEFGWSKKEIQQLYLSTATLPAFCDAFFARPMIKAGKTHWAEKTPANVLRFPQFMQAFEDAYVVHTIRDPLDTISSMISRGMSVLEAASIYLMYTAQGLALKGSPGYIEVRYESLANDPAKTLESQVLEPLGLKFFPEMLDSGNPAMSGVTKMTGWRQDELAEVTDQSVSRFHDESPGIQSAIVATLASVKISDAHAQRHNLQHETIEQVCGALKYPYPSGADAVDLKLQERLMNERKGLQRHLKWRGMFAPREDFPVELTF